MAIDHQAELRNIRTFPSLIRYLRDEMDWPIQSDDFEELTFEYTPEELGIDAASAAKIQEIRRLRPAEPNQPWGIFFVKFEPKKLPVVALRRILSRVVLKKRASVNSADRMAWQMSDLLFVSNYGLADERRISLAYFTDDQEMGDLPSLKVLGWDEEDTARHIDHVTQELRTKLRWPEDPSNFEAWRAGWASAFSLGHREVITTSQRLADRLAELARGIRMRVSEALAIETKAGPLRKLMAAFEEGLIHDLTEDGFADMYAQTVAYGLLSARISRPAGLSADYMSDLVPITSPFLKDLMENFIRLGGRRKADEGAPGIDFDELGVNDVVQLLRDANMEAVIRDFGDRNPQEDPVMHFYENFLTGYDKKQKVSRGVFYTPQPVVSYIVRSVHELLQNEFGLTDGLADTTTWGEMLKKHPNMKLPPLTDEPSEERTISPDEPFVQILDPATGTATFLVEVIDVIHRTLAAKWKQQRLTDAQQRDSWNDYVPQHLLPRLHAYELMMAPYAIAHMKIGLKLAETGYRFGTEERARIYLTNSLEPWLKQLPLLGFDSLAREATAVNEIKRSKRFTVVIGNPPYSIVSANMSDTAKALVDQYRSIDGVRIRERGALKSEVILQDDYVKFFGCSQNIVRLAGDGIIGMITNANCYENPVLRGFRYSLQSQFQLIHALDLGGQSKAGVDSDENVFEIDTSVAVSILMMHPTVKQTRRITRLKGSQLSKYRTLLDSTSEVLCATEFHAKPEQYLFKAFESSFGDEYDDGFPIDRAFGITSIGIKTARDQLVLDIDKSALTERIDLLRNQSLSAAQLREQFAITDNTQWRFTDALPKFRASYDKEHYAEVEARPFDKRWLYFHPTLVFNTRPTINRHVHRRQNLCLLTMRRIRTEDYAHFFVIDRIGMGEILSSADNCNFYPLYVYHDDILTQNSRPEPNFTQEFMSAIRSRFPGESSGPTPEEIFHYVYAVFHSPEYRSRYEEFLKIDYPRLPLTEKLELFRRLALLGKNLVSIHLMESPDLAHPITKFIGNHRSSIEKVSWSADTVWLDKAQTTGFQGVTEDLWNLHIGSYQVCEKWLKDRGPKKGMSGRTLTDEDIEHYQKIVVALNETIRIVAEIDDVIEQYGGWPSAFTAGDKIADN